MESVVKSVQSWTTDVAKCLHPYSKSFKAVDWYFATGGYDDINVEWSRSFNGYSNDHFIPQSLAAFYGAKKARFCKDFSVELFF